MPSVESPSSEKYMNDSWTNMADDIRETDHDK